MSLFYKKIKKSLATMIVILAGITMTNCSEAEEKEDYQITHVTLNVKGVFSTDILDLMEFQTLTTIYNNDILFFSATRPLGNGITITLNTYEFPASFSAPVSAKIKDTHFPEILTKDYHLEYDIQYSLSAWHPYGSGEVGIDVTSAMEKMECKSARNIYKGQTSHDIVSALYEIKEEVESQCNATVKNVVIENNKVIVKGDK